MRDKVISTYIKKIKRNYRGPKATKKRFIDELSKSLAQFMQENPYATMSDIEKTFGKPNEIKDSFLIAYEDEIQKRNYKFAVIMAIALGCLLIVSITYSLANLSKSFEQRNGYFTEEFHKIDPHDDPFQESPSDPTPLEIIK